MDEEHDIWGSSRKITSKAFESYKDTYAKTGVKVKAVILPKGGLSYNPTDKDHKALLRKVALKEEEIVEKNLKDLKKVRPLLYGENNDEFDQDDKLNAV